MLRTLFTIPIRLIFLSYFLCHMLEALLGYVQLILDIGHVLIDPAEKFVELVLLLIEYLFENDLDPLLQLYF